MKHCFIFFMLAALAGSAAAQVKLNKRLSLKIDSLAAVDQKPRHADAGKAAAEFESAIHSNFPHVKAIFRQYGFPGYDLVGKQSAHHYWMLVQHSDFEPLFQQQVAKAMQKEVKGNNASGVDYAYLVDRIEINARRPQIYGTQVNMGPKGTKIKPTIDTLNLDKRRAAVGLEPIADYLKRNDEIFKALNNGTLDQLEAKQDSSGKSKSGN